MEIFAVSIGVSNMTKKQKRKQAIENDKYIQSLSAPWKQIMSTLRYGRKELLYGAVFILTVALVISLYYIIMFNIWFVDGNVEYKPQNIKDAAEAVRGQ